MKNRTLLSFLAMVFITVLATIGAAQNIQPYPHAVTDRMIHPKTSMAPPHRNIRFTDPDFGSSMVRATDRSTNFKLPGTFLRTEGSGKENEWNSDSSKFYVIGQEGQTLAFAFDPETMIITSLPSAAPGRALLVPLRAGATFSFVDPDLIYGTSGPNTLIITSYRFSTGASVPIIDTTRCGMQPPLISGPAVVSDDDVSLSLDDTRISISEGGPQFGKHMFVVVYDKRLGCRWYNTQTGQIGGKWGATGTATITTPYLIRHAYLARSGNYVVIGTNWAGWFVWDLATLNVSHCVLGSGMDCYGYGAVGYNTQINGPTVLDDMETVKRPLSNLAQTTELYYPLPEPRNWGQPQHFTWSNVDVHDSTPVCGSTYSYDGDSAIDQPYAGEVFCMETDERASTIWRFAHNRATYIAPFFNTQPLGSVSRDGRFYLFTSDWDKRLGLGPDGKPRSDAFIVKLE